ncbi:MAG: sensor histidine kinase [Bacteroidota bacterium]|nr:sensor histidine kinase [Bacteroidota bacterium]
MTLCVNLPNSISEYIKIFFSMDNPVFYAFFFIILILVFVRIVYQKQFKPAENKWLREKQKLKKQNDRIMALFAELDPNPLIRVDLNGTVIKYNDAAASIFDLTQPGFQQLLQSIFPDNFRSLITENKDIIIEHSINGRYYFIDFKGIKELNIGQIYFSDLTEIKNKEKVILESEQRFKQLSIFLQDQLETEKQRIGMELHDSIGQNLLFVNLKLTEAIETKNFNGKLNEVKDALDSTITDVRNTMMDLKPRLLDDMGLYSAVYDLAQRVTRNTGIRSSVDVSGTEVRFNQKAELYLFRIIQEACNNIIKHSHADEFNIQLLFGTDSLKVFISDDGVGFDMEKLKDPNSKGNGLFNISERTKDINGIIEFDSNKGEGTMISIEVPLKETVL